MTDKGIANFDRLLQEQFEQDTKTRQEKAEENKKARMEKNRDNKNRKERIRYKAEKILTASTMEPQTPKSRDGEAQCLAVQAMINHNSSKKEHKKQLLDELAIAKDNALVAADKKVKAADKKLLLAEEIWVKRETRVATLAQQDEEDEVALQLALKGIFLGQWEQCTMVPVPTPHATPSHSRSSSLSDLFKTPAKDAKAYMVLATINSDSKKTPCDDSVVGAP